MPKTKKSEEEYLLDFFGDEPNTEDQSQDVSCDDSIEILDETNDPSIICLDDSERETSISSRKIKTAKRRCQSAEVPTGEDSPPQDRSKPFFKVKFKNSHVSRLFRDRIERFLQELLSEEDLDSAREKTEDLCVYGTFSVDSSSQSSSVHAVEQDASLSQNVIMEEPQFQPEFEITLGDETPPSEVLNTVKKKKRIGCFNCGAEHSISQCKEKRDHAKIQAARLEFQNNKGKSFTPKSSRYHIEVGREPDQDSRFVAGSPSPTLLEALGVRENHLPDYIYKMRVMGYPPGWLLEAQDETSGVNLFDGEGKTVGEDTSCQGNNVEYDFKRIVDFPGFNVYPPTNTKDEASRLGYPPLMPHHLKKNWKIQLRGQVAKQLKRKQAPVTENRKRRSREVGGGEAEMEISDGENSDSSGSSKSPPPTTELDRKSIVMGGLDSKVTEKTLRHYFANYGKIEKCTITKNKSGGSACIVYVSEGAGVRAVTAKTHIWTAGKLVISVDVKHPKLSSTTGNSASSSRTATPELETHSLEDLEAQKAKLLATLGEDTVDTTQPVAVNSGTPLMKSVSGVIVTPTASAWSKNISAHIPHENLPGATGKYKHMRTLLQGVRKKVTQLQHNEQ